MKLLIFSIVLKIEVADASKRGQVCISTVTRIISEQI
jgi:hypothetical protein